MPEILAINVERESGGARVLLPAHVGLSGVRVYVNQRGVLFILDRDGKFLACCPHCDRKVWYEPFETKAQIAARVTPECAAAIEAEMASAHVEVSR